MDPNNDHAMLDVEENRSGNTILQTSSDGREIREPANGLVISAIQSPPPVMVNGSDRTPQTTQDTTLNNTNGSLASPLPRFIQSSRASSVLTHEVIDQLSIDSSRRSRQHSDEDSSDDNSSDSMPRPIPLAGLPTGLCYDVRMRYHCELDPPKQRLDFHPEDPRRIYFIYKELCKAGLVDDILSTQPLVDTPLHRIPARNATQAEICLVHDKKHFDFIESTKGILALLYAVNLLYTHKMIRHD